MPVEVYQVELSDGSVFEVETEGGPPSEAQVWEYLSANPETPAPTAKPPAAPRVPMLSAGNATPAEGARRQFNERKGEYFREAAGNVLPSALQTGVDLVKGAGTGLATLAGAAGEVGSEIGNALRKGVGLTPHYQESTPDLDALAALPGNIKDHFAGYLDPGEVALRARDNPVGVVADVAGAATAGGAARFGVKAGVRGTANAVRGGASRVANMSAADLAKAAHVAGATISGGPLAGAAAYGKGKVLERVFDAIMRRGSHAPEVPAAPPRPTTPGASVGAGVPAPTTQTGGAASMPSQPTPMAASVPVSPLAPVAPRTGTSMAGGPMPTEPVVPTASRPVTPQQAAPAPQPAAAANPMMTPGTTPAGPVPYVMSVPKPKEAPKAATPKPAPKPTPKPTPKPAPKPAPKEQPKPAPKTNKAGEPVTVPASQSRSGRSGNRGGLSDNDWAAVEKLVKEGKSRDDAIAAMLQQRKERGDAIYKQKQAEAAAKREAAAKPASKPAQPAPAPKPASKPRPAPTAPAKGGKSPIEQLKEVMDKSMRQGTRETRPVETAAPVAPAPVAAKSRYTPAGPSTLSPEEVAMIQGPLKDLPIDEAFARIMELRGK